MVTKTDISNALADCLLKIRAGATVEEVLIDYPQMASQLRELLITALEIQNTSKTIRVPASTQVNSRRRMLAQAQELKRRDAAHPFLPLLRLLNRHAGTILFSLTALTLLFLALGSTRALPGDSLYPMKLAAEQAGASISVGSSAQSREDYLDNHRMAEISTMIQLRRVGNVQFAGYLEQKSGAGWSISGIPLEFPVSTERQANELLSVYVEVGGYLNPTGVVTVNMIKPRLETIKGTLAKVQESTWQVSGRLVQIGKITNLTGSPQLGDQVTIQAARMRNSRDLFAVTITMDGQTVSETTETPENTLTTQPTLNLLPSSTPPPAVNTPEPEDDPKPEIQATPDDEHEGEKEDDSKEKEKDDSNKRDN